jgi:NAD(P)-dependent dehydrogenase (short-subunit alcohol dehydrogenase family)
MSLELEGQIAVVTGGAAGIGAAVVSELTRRGVSVAIVDLVEVDQVRLKEQALYPSQKVSSWVCDVTRSADVNAVCRDILKKIGEPTILVNNAGGSGAVKAVQVEDITDALWDEIISLNLTSILRFCRALVPSMKEKRYGKIINVSSTLRHGQLGEGGTVGARLPYVTAKSAIVGMTKQLAKDLGPFGISVNAVAPGFTLPDPDARITKRFEALSSERRDHLLSNIPMKRPGLGADIAAAVSFLASPYNSYISGQVVAVDGGAT